jgi:hypothetical protein
MAVSITHDYLNQAKREEEALTVTLPSLLREGGGRAGTLPSYVQYGESYLASVVVKNSIAPKLYLVVEEAFPTGATATVTVGGTAAFTDLAVDATGANVSATEDVYFTTGGDVSITINHATETGNVNVGKLKVVVPYIPFDVKNGRYSDVPAV